MDGEGIGMSNWEADTQTSRAGGLLETTMTYLGSINSTDLLMRYWKADWNAPTKSSSPSPQRQMSSAPHRMLFAGNPMSNPSHNGYAMRRAYQLTNLNNH